LQVFIIMVELSNNIPFLWRLSPESGDGFCMVSMVVPFESEDEDQERGDLTIETSVVSFSADSSRSETEEMLEWNQDDMNLFLKLVTCQQHGEHAPVAESVRVDLTDPQIIEIIHVVAAAGFGTAYSSYGILNSSVGRYPPHACDLGSFAALNTLDGFKRCVVVDMDGEDVVCVLLEEVDVVSVGEYDKLSRHDLLMVKQTDLLHPDFASLLTRPPHATLH
jgi:hypothetical protein